MAYKEFSLKIYQSSKETEGTFDNPKSKLQKLICIITPKSYFGRKNIKTQGTTDP